MNFFKVNKNLKNQQMDTIKSSIFRKLSIFIVSLFISTISYAQLVVDGIDLMEGFTFGAAVEFFNPIDFSGRHWTVTRTDDPDPFATEAEMYGSLRWAINKTNETAGTNYIDFNLPIGSVIYLEMGLPVITNSIIIDGKPELNRSPRITINFERLYENDPYYNGIELKNVENSVIQGIYFKNSYYQALFISLSNNTKILSNLINDTNDFYKPVGYWGMSIQSGSNNQVRGNIIGTDLSLNLDYIPFSDAIFIHNEINIKVGGESILDRNVISNALSYGVEGFVRDETVLNQQYRNNLFYKNGVGITFFRGMIQNEISRNLFYENAEFLRLLQDANNSKTGPIFQTVEEFENVVLINGISNTQKDRIEVFLSTESGKDAIKYLGTATANVQDATDPTKWKWQLVQGSADWDDPNFHLKSGQKVIATATDIFNNTSTFSSAFAVTNISESVLNFIPECSSNPAIVRNWKVINTADAPISCEYTSPIDQSVISYIAPQGESFMAVNISDPQWNETISLTYNYDGFTNNIILNSTLETCEGISCEFYDFTLTPQHVFCAYENTGAVIVDLMGASLVSYEWSHGATQLNLTDEYADEYELTLTVLDDTGNECVKTKTVEILESDVNINLKVEDIVGCENTGALELVGVTVIPFDENESQYNCQSYPESDFPKTSCESGEELYGSESVVISDGEVRVIPEGYIYDGNLIINGGKLVVCGYFQASNLTFNGGEIVINGMMEQTDLTVSSGSVLQNFGTIECESITISGELININDISSAEDLKITTTGSIVNYGDIDVMGNLINQSTLDNYNEIYISKGFFNQAGSLFNNYCRFISKIIFENDGTVNNSGFINVVENFINEVSREIYVLDGSEFLIGNLENNGSIITNASDCFCFTILSGTELTENSSILNQFLSQGSGDCNCSYSSGTAYNATIVELDEERIIPTINLTGLTSGEHELKVDINGCEVGIDFEVNGGLYFEVMSEQTICAGDEIWIGCEVNGEGNGTEITWDNQESIIDYVANQGQQQVNPDVTTIYTINVLTAEGCPGSKTITVNVIPAPEITMIADQSICNGESVTLDVTTTAPVSYIWNPVESLSVDNIKNPVATPSQTTEYGVIVTETSSGYNCTSTGNVQVEVKPTPELNITRSDNGDVNCENSNVQLEASGGVSYSWLPIDGLSNATISNPVASPAVTTEYTVTGTGENACVSTASTTVEMAIIPDFQIGVDETDCIAPQRHLYVRGGGVSFNWTPAEFLDDPAIAEPIATITGETVFTVEITTEDGCIYLEQLTVNIPSWPVAENVTINYGETAQLNATGGVDGTYNWTPSFGLNQTNIPNPISSVQATTSYEVTVLNEYTCENTKKVYVIVDPTGRCQDLSLSGITYLWTGSVSDDWNNPANWDDGSPVNVNIPGSDPTQDNVIIDNVESPPYFPKLNQNVEIHRICFKGGELDLSNYSLLINGDATFTGGEIQGVTLVNAEALKLELDGSGESQSVYFGNTAFNCNVSVQASPEILLNGATFNGYTILEQNGNNEIACNGGNNFNNETQIINSGTGIWRLAYINEGTKDNYNADVTFKTTSTGTIYPNSSHDDEFKGDIYIEGEGVVFGSNGGVTFLNADVDQYIGGQVNTTPPVFRKLIVEKNKTDGEGVDLAYADIYLEIPIQVGLNNEEEDKLVLTDGVIFTTEENILTISEGISVEGVSNLSFIDGPVKKIGNEDFVFPVGKIDRYMPIKISDAISSNTSTEFIAEFLDINPDGLPDETMENISSCEYWRLTKPLDDPDEVTVTLFWDRNSCDIPTDVTKLKVTSKNASTWNNLGLLEYTGSKSEGGSIKSEIAATNFEAFAIGAEIIPGYGPTVGMSFNNYGANISITNCDIYVNGNVLNENDEKGTPGVISNDGVIIIANDWTNNAQKEAFGTTSGSINFDGNYQRIRGSQPTEFNQLWLAGFGKKEMFNDVDVISKLNLFDNQLEVRDYSLFIKTNQSGAVENNTGYVSSMDKGHIARIIAATNNESYLFPVGGHSLYRPVYLTPLDEGDETDDIFRMRFIYNNPTNQGANTDLKSASVVSINQNFFYEIEKEEGTGENDFFSLEMKYNKSIDGAFQSIGQWSTNPKTEFIGNMTDDEIWLKLNRITPEVDELNDIIPNILTLDRVSNFDSPKFALIQGAFIINTDNFGDPFGDGSNIEFTVGDSDDNGGTIYDSDNPGTDVGQPIAPEDMEIEHIMQIFDSPLTLGGIIIIKTDGNGDIKLMTDSEDQYQIYFLDNGIEKPLAKDLYTVKNGNILELHQEPNAFEINCDSDLKVSFSEEDPLVFNRSNPQFTITGAESDKVESMLITELSSDTEFPLITDPLNWIGNEIINFGVYKFELTITTDTGTQKFSGQFIVE
jgi:hypothetical protein